MSILLRMSVLFCGNMEIWFLFSSHQVTGTANNPAPVDRMLLLPTGNSSDENDESLTAKLLESQKQVGAQRHVTNFAYNDQERSLGGG